MMRLILAITLLSLGRSAFATVGVSLNVSPFDNPFLAGDQGIPSDGNSVQAFEDPAQQTFFEGRDNGLQTNNKNFAVFVGQTSAGTLLIDGGSALRDEDLIIGDAFRYKSTPSATSIIGLGSGTVRITDTGSLYNNNPSIIPSGLPSNFGSVTPRPNDDSSGFDLYVGTANKNLLQYQQNLTDENSGTTVSLAPDGVGGSGTLAISAGGSAEIEDSVVVGDVAGSTGSITVDGNDSFLGSGGYKTATIDVNDPHRMVIGRQGVGSLSITNGGTVQAIAPGNGTTTGNSINMAATIGDMPFVPGSASTTPGGSGSVTVGSTNGSLSKWLVAGSLQVGGFVDFPSGLPGATFTDLTGGNSLYTPLQGQATLNIQSGGLVNVNLAPGIDPNQVTPLFVAVGFYGHIAFSGGTLSVGEVNNTGSSSRQDQIQVVNDGIISGSGTILTGVFRNRYAGRVFVDAGDTLNITATSFFPPSPTGTVFQPLYNFGLIEVSGTQDARATIDFERSPGNSTNGALPGQPLVNQSVFTSPASSQFSGGMITSQWGTIRSGSGILNQGVIAFIAGSNIVQARVNNTATGAILLYPNTTVAVEDSCLGCNVTMFPGGGSAFHVLDQHTFTSAGTITMPLNLTNPNLITSAGDIGISGTIAISLESDVKADLAAHGPGQSYSIIEFGGEAYQTKLDSSGIPQVDTSKVIPDCTGIALCTIPGLGVTGPNLAAMFGPSFNNIVPVAQRIGGEIMISFINPAAGGASGPDFNGDGVVDLRDFDIWRLNVGITSGATVLQGDANGDGKVDGADFLLWQQHLGPYPGAGSGSSFANNSAAVPEPTAIALVLLSGIAWLPIRRRRAG